MNGKTLGLQRILGRVILRAINRWMETQRDGGGKMYGVRERGGGRVDRGTK